MFAVQGVLTNTVTYRIKLNTNLASMNKSNLNKIISDLANLKDSMVASDNLVVLTMVLFVKVAPEESFLILVICICGLVTIEAKTMSVVAVVLINNLDVKALQIGISLTTGLLARLQNCKLFVLLNKISPILL
eukprot:NODE_383_length_8356_cov_0.477898.p6 type:complete len:133 gc:universal NODE_383_length_8356_cov_0.477898:1231-833(-)